MGYHTIGGPNDLTKEHAATIREMVKEIVLLENLVNERPITCAAIYRSLQRCFKVPTYLTIKDVKFIEAVEYLNRKIRGLVREAKKQGKYKAPLSMSPARQRAAAGGER